jgi:hypothetical protein
MSAERDKMIVKLKEKVVPVLKARGFKGSFPHFRRVTEKGIHLLSFQFDKWGGGFVVEVAACPPAGISMHWGEQVSPEKVTSQHVNVSKRLRLGASDAKSDYWFRYDGGGIFNRSDLFEKAANEVLTYLDGQAEDWWKQETEQNKSAP